MGRKLKGAQPVEAAALLLEVNAKLDALLASRQKEPIVNSALYSLKEIALLCGYSYPSVHTAAVNGHLATRQTAVGRQAWGRDVKAWINDGGKTGRRRATKDNK